MAVDELKKIRQKRLSRDFLVGALALTAIGLMVVFAWLMGAVGPFKQKSYYDVMYGFASGVEVGSPVRVSGVKVGRVESIDFVSALDQGAALKLRISVSKVASNSVRADSKFYINMAGIIGQRYIEITPGQGELIPPGSKLRGIDPPRIDQLLSQGYGVFGQIEEFLSQNQETISSFLNEFKKMMSEMNKILGGKDKKKVVALLSDLAAISSDVRRFTTDLSNEKAQKFFERLSVLIERAHEIDKPALKQFLQEEGIRARIF